jgi:hypothetical protein
MESILENCNKLLTKIGSAKYAVEGNYPDLSRLCERAEGFQQMLEDLSSNPKDEVEEEVQTSVTELGKTFKQIVNFIHDHTDRKKQFGTTELSYRINYVGDLARLTLALTRNAESLNVPSETDGENRRKEDCEVCFLLTFTPFFICINCFLSFLGC